jgi:hypothetical protein
MILNDFNLNFIVFNRLWETPKGLTRPESEL